MNLARLRVATVTLHHCNGVEFRTWATSSIEVIERKSILTGQEITVAFGLIRRVPTSLQHYSL